MSEKVAGFQDWPDGMAIPSVSSETRARFARTFGRAMTEQDERFFGMREAGYTGWIDQDSQPVSQAEHQADIDRRIAAQEAKGLKYTSRDGWVPAEQEAGDR